MANPRVIVVGAGAAGLTAAIRAGESGARVTLLNAHPKVGLKILMSGGTRCNVTHATVTERDYFGGSRKVVARILRAFSAVHTLAWFEDELGVPLKLEPTGKYFPQSDDAQTVLDALLAAANRARVTLRPGARVTRLVREGAIWRVGLRGVANSAETSPAVQPSHKASWKLPEEKPVEWLEAERVILATGGLSFPRTGSDGSGYALVESLGHTLVTPVPALTPLTSSDPFCRGAQGVTLEAELTLWVDGRVSERTRGSLLMTHFGYSGPPALDMSRHWLRAEGRPRKLTISLLPNETRQSLEDRWVVYAEKNGRRGAHTWLAESLPERVADMVIAESGVGGAAMSQIPRQYRNALLDSLLARDAQLTGTLGYEKAEVTAGGVLLSEVDPSTLESRKSPGLYLCGEILDVEGRLGGFNFQWSWSSGTVAGRAAAKK